MNSLISKKLHELNELNLSSPVIDKINMFDAFLVEESIKNNERLNNPFYASWNITNRCNNNCIYCINQVETISLDEMTFENKIETIIKLKNMGIKHIRLLGGEPSIVDGFNNIIKFILDNDIYLSFSTNGFGINENTINVLKNYSVYKYQIHVSLDSIVEKNNDRSRGYRSCRIALNAIEKLLSIENINLTVFSVFTKYTVRDILKTYEYMDRLRVPILGGVIPVKRGKATDEIILPLTVDFLEDLIKVKTRSLTSFTEFFTSLGYEAVDNSILPKRVTKEMKKNSDIYFRTKCNCAVTRLHIESNGDFYPCDNLKFPEFNLGNCLETKDILTLWGHEKMNEIWSIRRLHKENCNKCKHYYCSTGCMGLTYGEYGTLYKKDPNCKIII